MDDNTLPDGTPAGDINPSASATTLPSGLVVTERMKAVARGENPDAISRPPATPEAAEVADDSVQTPPPAAAPKPTKAAATSAEPATPATPADPPATWYNGQDKRQAELYGMTEYDLDGFTSRRDFLSATRFLDRQTAATVRGQKPGKPGEVAAEPEVAEELGDDVPLDPKTGRINPKYFDKNYDPAAAEAFKTLQKQNDELAAWRQGQEKAEYDRQAEAYSLQMHDSIDALDRPELYGEPKKSDISDAEFDNRIKVSDEVAILAQACQIAGRPLPPMIDLIRRAEANLFPEQVAAAASRQKGDARQQQLEAIARQSQGRRPVASGVSAQGSHAAAPPADAGSTDSIMANPAVSSLFRRFEEENGRR